MPGDQHFVWSLTLAWSGWVDASDALSLQPHLQVLFAVFLTRWIYQLERGKVSGHLHYQCCISTAQKKTLTGLRAIVEAHLRTILPDEVVAAMSINLSPCSKNGQAALKAYAMKKDETYVAGPWTDKTTAEDVKDPGNEYDYSDLLTRSVLDPWQRQLEDQLAMLKPTGQIHWFYDTIGGKGKTEFAKYLAHKFLTPLLGYGSASNLANLVFKSKKRSHYVFDLTRAKPTDLGSADLYSLVEGLSNGRLINLKYETGVWCNFKAHVVVFANQPPGKGMLSRDRLRVASLNHCPTKRVYDKLAEIDLPGVPFMTAEQLDAVQPDDNPRAKKKQKVQREEELVQPPPSPVSSPDLPQVNQPVAVDEEVDTISF